MKLAKVSIMNICNGKVLRNIAVWGEQGCFFFFWKWKGGSGPRNAVVYTENVL